MSEAVFATLLNHTMSIYRRDRTSDGQGGWAISYALLGTLVGRIRPASSAERETAALEEREISHVLYVRAAEDVQRGDQVELAVGEGGPLVVDVLGVREPSRAGHHLEIDCMERVGETTVEAGS
jgi:head-tail adaptor